MELFFVIFQGDIKKNYINKSENVGWVFEWDYY